MARFADCFWDENDKGVEVIIDKLKMSRETCDEINKLYEIRAQIEEEYGEKLLKLSQMMVGESEEGTLSESVSHIPSAIETTARAHVDLAQQLRQNLQSTLTGFIKDHNEKRKAQELQIENSKQLRVNNYANVVRAKDQYFAEQSKLTGMEKYLKERRNEMPPDEVEQIEQDVEEQKKLIETAGREYKRSVDVFNDVTEKWIADWRGSCDVFQGLEEARINFIRSSLWGFANMMSSVYIVDDQCCERIRTSLEVTDVEHDVQMFIDKYGTGTRVTDLMPYEDLSQPTAQPHRGSQPPPPTAALPPPPTALPQLPSQEPNNHSSQSLHQTVPSGGLNNNNNLRNSTSSNNTTTATTTATNRNIPPTSTQQTIPPIIFPEVSSSTTAKSQERQMDNQSQQQQGDNHDTVSFAFEEVENMLSSVGTSFDLSNGGLRQSLVWATQQNQQKVPSGAPMSSDQYNPPSTQTQRPISPPIQPPVSATSVTVPPISAVGSASIPAPEPTLHMAAADPTSPQHMTSITSFALTNALDAAASSASLPVTHPSESSQSRLSAVGVPATSDTTSTTNNNYTTNTRNIPSGSNVITSPISRSTPIGSAQPSSSSASSLTNTTHNTMSNIPPPSPGLKNNSSGIEFNNSSGTGNGSNLRFKPIPNPTYEPEQKRNSQEGDKSPLPTGSISASARIPVPGPINNNDDDDESEDEFPPLARRKPKEEKWMISSIRRPQQLPVRSQNARIYDRQSTYEAFVDPTMIQQRPPLPKLHIDTGAGSSNSNTGNGTGGGAHQVMTTVRAQLEQANSLSSSTPPDTGINNPGIRNAPWQPSSEPPAVTNYYKRATTGGVGGLQRQGSVNGPRPESDMPPMPGEDYVLNNNSHQRKQFDQQSARRHQSAYVDMGMHQQQDSRPPITSTLSDDNITNKDNTSNTGGSSNSGGHFGGRVSIPFFGKKDKQKQQQKPPPMPQQQVQFNNDQQPQNQQLQSPQPQSQQLQNQQPQQSEIKSERLSDGAPILYYTRSMWSYNAKIPQEMSFNAGDTFAVVHEQPDGWWEAELLDPKRPGRALIPGNYMEKIQ